MDTVKKIISAKPRWMALLIFSYILVLAVLKWRLTPDIETVYYLIGGAVGIYFLDLADLLFSLHPSPFRSIPFMILYAVVSFFVVTSSGSAFASGLVLSLYFSLLLSAAEDWQEARNLNDWYRLMRETPSVRIQQWIILGLAILLIIETILFIFS